MPARNPQAHQRLRLRYTRGLSQEELADLSGLHQTYISDIDRGIRNPTVMVVDRLAEALKAEPEELVTRKHAL